MGKQSNLSVSERREAVLALLRRDQPASALARTYGVSENTLYRWRDEFIAGGESALSDGRGKSDPRDRRIAELEKALAERDLVVGELTVANRLFKKHLGDCR